MKANRKYTHLKDLKIMDTIIHSNSCTDMKITFSVDARHILLAITCLPEDEKPSRKKIEEMIRRELFYRGEMWYSAPIDYAEEGVHWNLQEKLKEVLPVGKKFFPEFFNTPNSIKFIKGLG